MQYLLAVKGNQPTPYQQVSDQISASQSVTEGFEHVRHDHGRTVMQMSCPPPAARKSTRRCGRAARAGCVVSQRIVGEKVAGLEERYYLSSRPLSAEQLA